jgi:CubicO group peptidase (beta-lactamase class C family)
MYCLAAHIIEHVMEIPFPQFITENIISPLGVSCTTYNVTEAKLSGRLADGFLSPWADENTGEGKRKLVLKPIPFWTTEHDSGLMAGAGGVISTANDLVCNIFLMYN